VTARTSALWAAAIAAAVTVASAPAVAQERKQDPPLTILGESKTVTIPPAISGKPYAFTFQASGGRPPLRWVVIDGETLPKGIDLDPESGKLSGTSKAPADYPFTLQVSDSAGARSEKVFSLTVRERDATLLHALHKDLGLTLRQRDEVDDDGGGSGPATLDFAHNRHGKSEYEINAALIWTHHLRPIDDSSTFELTGIRSSLDLHLGSDRTDDERGLTLRAGLTGFVRPLFPWYFQINGLYESDQSFDDQRAGPELKFAPILPDIGVGRPVRLIPKSDLFYIGCQPWVGSAFGIPIRQSDKTADDDVITRFFATSRFELTSPPLDEILGASVTGFLELKGYRVFAKDDPSDGRHGFIQTGLNVQFGSHVSIEAGYKKGENAPDFDTHVRKIYVSLGLSF
jgi:hypothetical protein